jgi:pimeloyl-ACP methyl ester carboxylesterase
METLLKNDTFISSLNWKNKGSLVPVYNKNIFTIDTGGDHENCIVILHGYLSSSYDYHKVIPELSKNNRVIIHDLIGFGLSDKLENKYFTIIDQSDYVLKLWDILGLNNFTLIAHDYGNLITQEILARKNHGTTNIEIKKILFCNGSVPVNHTNYLDKHTFYTDEDSKKMISMLTSFGIYKKIMREFFYDESKITEEELYEMWTLLEYNNGREIINFIYNYVRERKIFWNRWTSALKDTTVPIDLVWGKEQDLTEDCIINLKGAKNTTYNIYWIEKSGHFPMLESPKEWLLYVLKDQTINS